MATEDDPTTPPPTIDWTTAPEQLRTAHDKARKDAGQAREELATAQREIALLRAGVDAEHPAYSYFNAGYKGELSTDDIQAEWAKITGGQQQTPPPAGEQPPAGQPQGQQLTPDGLTAEQAAQLQALQQARGTFNAGGAVAPGQEPSPDPMETALATFHQARTQGSNQEQAMRQAFQVMFDAAVAGDGRIAFDSADAQMRAWKQKHGEDVW